MYHSFWNASSCIIHVPMSNPFKPTFNSLWVPLQKSSTCSNNHLEDICFKNAYASRILSRRHDRSLTGRWAVMQSILLAAMSHIDNKMIENASASSIHWAEAWIPEMLMLFLMWIESSNHLYRYNCISIVALILWRRRDWNATSSYISEFIASDESIILQRKSCQGWSSWWWWPHIGELRHDQCP